MVLCNFFFIYKKREAIRLSIVYNIPLIVGLGLGTRLQVRSYIG